MKKQQVLSIGLSLAGAILCIPHAVAQNSGNWSTARNDTGHAGWQKVEDKISKDSVPAQFKLLWKIKLGSTTKDYESYSEPLLVPRLINAHGFKDLVVWSGSEDLYAVDSELGRIEWTKHFDVKESPCDATNLPMVMEPPPMINFGARRAPGSRPPQPQPPMKASDRRIGVAAGGGGFGLRGIYVLTPDGNLHEQILATGADFGPPVKFLAGPAGVSQGISLSGKTLYAATKSGCDSTNAVWSINVSSADYPVASYQMKSIAPLTPMGPTLGDSAIAYVVTGDGASNGDVHANSVVALTPDAKVSDWYTPSGATKLESVTPVAFTYKQKKLLAAPGGDGTFVLLDRESLGGQDHHTPLARTPSLFKLKRTAVGALANWQQTNGTSWILVSIPGPLSSEAKFATSNGPTPHGSVVAYRVEGEGDKATLVPAWVSRDLINPAPPVIANGLVVVLAQGNATTHAQLIVLDGDTGKELYSSGDAIPTYAHNAGVAVGDGHAFFVTRDNTLYSFGIGMEH